MSTDTKEIDLDASAQDEIARVVLQRYYESWVHKGSHEVYQGKSIDALREQADRQIAKIYTPRQRGYLQDMFGSGLDPKYDSITQEKVEAVTDWYADLFVASLDKVFTIAPTPDPELDSVSIARVKEDVAFALQQKMQELGIQDPTLLLMPDGTPSPQLKDFLENQARVLRKAEQARIHAIAEEACQRVQVKMRDVIVEGGFRQAYSQFSRDRFLYGMGVMKFPDWQRRRQLKHDGRRARPKFELMPMFRRVLLEDFFPTVDATLDLQACLGVTERKLITKIDLVNLANLKQYREKEVLDVLDEFTHVSRAWLPSAIDLKESWDESYWSPDGHISCLIHEGYFTGNDLKEMGIKGVKDTEYVNAHVEVCGRRTIRCEVMKMPAGPERSYFAAPLSIVGDSFWDSVGVAAKVYDIESRINFIMHLAIDNMDWAANPPKLVNSQAFDNPTDADSIAPGRKYKINDMYAASGNPPDPLRPMTPVSSQYHILISEVGVLRRMADDASGIPAYAYGGAEYGRASLGEFAQRMTNALRTIKGAARREDEYFTEPAFSALFRYLCEHDETFDEGQDLECVIRGMAGLLEESKKEVDKQAAIQVAMQGVQMGVIDPSILKATVRDALRAYGVPVDALSPDDDPLQSQAFSVAAESASVSQQQNQIPALDGRNNAAQATTADPSGASPQITGGAP